MGRVALAISCDSLWRICPRGSTRYQRIPPEGERVHSRWTTCKCGFGSSRDLWLRNPIRCSGRVFRRPCARKNVFLRECGAAHLQLVAAPDDDALRQTTERCSLAVADMENAARRDQGTTVVLVFHGGG